MAKVKNKWKKFEQEKRRLEACKLSPAQYQAAIKQLCKKLKI